jgi:uncharacterized protein DUF4258
MTPSARRALRLIRTCIEEDRIIVTVHFSRRMDQRGMVWPDVLTAIDAPDDVRWGGGDESGRPKWHIAGRAADGLDIELVCVLDEDESDRMVVFVTLYWEQP